MLIGINIDDNKITMNEKDISEKPFKELSLKEKYLKKRGQDINISTIIPLF